MAKGKVRNRVKGGNTYKTDKKGNNIIPVMYCGSIVGYGNYMAGSVNGEMICDKDGKPIPYRTL